jgi:hypothetical protein
MTTPWTIAFTLLATLVVALCLLFLALARYVAALATRLPDPVPLQLQQGPAIGSPLYEHPLPRELVDGTNGDASTPVVVAFVSTSCAACRALVSDLNRFARDARGTRTVAVVTGSGEEAERLALALDRPERLIDRDGTLARSFGITTVPFALLYRDHALAAKGVVNNREMLENLAQGRVRADGDELLQTFAEADGH